MLLSPFANQLDGVLAKATTESPDLEILPPPPPPPPPPQMSQVGVRGPDDDVTLHRDSCTLTSAAGPVCLSHGTFPCHHGTVPAISGVSSWLHPERQRQCCAAYVTPASDSVRGPTLALSGRARTSTLRVGINALIDEARVSLSPDPHSTPVSMNRPSYGEIERMFRPLAYTVSTCPYVRMFERDAESKELRLQPGVKGVMAIVDSGLATTKILSHPMDFSRHAGGRDLNTEALSSIGTVRANYGENYHIYVYVHIAHILSTPTSDVSNGVLYINAHTPLLIATGNSVRNVGYGDCGEFLVFSTDCVKTLVYDRTGKEVMKLNFPNVDVTTLEFDGDTEGTTDFVLLTPLMATAKRLSSVGINKVRVEPSVLYDTLQVDYIVEDNFNFIRANVNSDRGGLYFAVNFTVPLTAKSVRLNDRRMLEEVLPSMITAQYVFRETYRSQASTTPHRGSGRYLEKILTKTSAIAVHCKFVPECWTSMLPMVVPMTQMQRESRWSRGGQDRLQNLRLRTVRFQDCGSLHRQSLSLLACPQTSFDRPIDCEEDDDDLEGEGEFGPQISADWGEDSIEARASLRKPHPPDFRNRNMSYVRPVSVTCEADGGLGIATLLLPHIAEFIYDHKRGQSGQHLTEDRCAEILSVTEFDSHPNSGGGERDAVVRWLTERMSAPEVRGTNIRSVERMRCRTGEVDSDLSFKLGPHHLLSVNHSFIIPDSELDPLRDECRKLEMEYSDRSGMESRQLGKAATWASAANAGVSSSEYEVGGGGEGHTTRVGPFG